VLIRAAGRRRSGRSDRKTTADSVDVAMLQISTTCHLPTAGQPKASATTAVHVIASVIFHQERAGGRVKPIVIIAKRVVRDDDVARRDPVDAFRKGAEKLGRDLVVPPRINEHFADALRREGWSLPPHDDAEHALVPHVHGLAVNILDDLVWTSCGADTETK
jgi:hypothetical protein